MEEQPLWSYPAGCVIKARNVEGTLCGMLYSRFYRQQVNFCSEVELLCAMEDLFEKLQYPGSFFERRFFAKSEKRKTEIKEAVFAMEDFELEQDNEERATFVVNVRFRRNASWQGNITWTEKGVSKPFRSALEMLMLMEEAQPSLELVSWGEDAPAGE